jgi:hypothetical protein
MVALQCVTNDHPIHAELLDILYLEMPPMEPWVWKYDIALSLRVGLGSWC